jgi:hypothetical protein
MLFLPGSSWVAPQCNYGWLPPPQTRRDNSVLCTTHSSTRLAQQSAISQLSEVISALHPTLDDSGKLYSLSMSFSFVQGRMQSPQELCWIIFPRGCVVCGAHPLGLQIHTSRSGTMPVGRNVGQHFPRQTLTGTGSRLVCVCRLSIG